MIVAAVAVVAVWTALLCTAYVTRAFGRVVAIGAVTACYTALAGLALVWLGRGMQGMLGAAGMLVPYAAAVASVRCRDHRRRDRQSAENKRSCPAPLAGIDAGGQAL